MYDRAERAASLFRQGYNCAQASFLAFSDLTGLDTDTAVRVASCFGGGIGRMREVCGAASGALMALGMLHTPEDPSDQAKKAEYYERIQRYAQRFRACNGALLCRDLLGNQAGKGPVPEARTESYYQRRPCEQIVFHAVRLMDELLSELRSV